MHSNMEARTDIVTAVDPMDTPTVFITKMVSKNKIKSRLVF